MLSYGKSPLVCGKQTIAIHLGAYGKMSEAVNLSRLMNFTLRNRFETGFWLGRSGKAVIDG